MRKKNPLKVGCVNFMNKPQRAQREIENKKIKTLRSLSPLRLMHNLGLYITESGRMDNNEHSL